MMVSIIIPTFNRPSLLQRAVASALAACPGDGEVIVVDDRSDTAVKALRSVDDHPRLRILTNTGDKGAAGARNHGVAHALGEIVMFLDDDDVMVADYPKRVLAAAQGSAADWGFSAVALTADPETTVDLGNVVRSGMLQTGVVSENVPLFDRMPGFGAGFWIRRNAFVAVGTIRTDLGVDEDTDYVCRLYGHQNRAWYEATAGCLKTRADAGSVDAAPQLTRSLSLRSEADCHLITFRRNQGLFGQRSGQRWALVRRSLQGAAFADLDSIAKDVIRDLTPLDWRLRAWLFWQMEKRGKKIHQQRIARKLARG